MARPNPETVNPKGRRTETSFAGVTTSFENLAVSRPKYRRTWTGSVTPGFKSLSSRQRKKLTTLNHTSLIETVASNGYTEIQSQRHVNGPYKGQLREQTIVWDAHAARDLLSVCSAVGSTQADSRALARLMQDLRGATVNFGQAFAERRQTADLIGNTLGRVVAAAIALKRGSAAAFGNALSISVNPNSGRWQRVVRDPPSKRLANHWLEYKFGWAPLYQDIYDSSELLAEHIGSDANHHTITGSATYRWEDRWQVNASGVVTSYEASHSAKRKYGIAYRLDSAARAVLNKTGISNPALVAWELLPWSFVVDWVYPVGNYIEALNAYDGFTFVGGYTVTYETAISNCVRGGQTKESWVAPNYYWRRQDIGFVTKTARRLTRTKLTSFPVANPPSLRNPIGGSPVERVATALSLLRQLFK